MFGLRTSAPVCDLNTGLSCVGGEGVRGGGREGGTVLEQSVLSAPQTVTPTDTSLQIQRYQYSQPFIRGQSPCKKQAVHMNMWSCILCPPSPPPEHWQEIDKQIASCIVYTPALLKMSFN